MFIGLQKSARERKGQSLLELLDDYVVVDLETTGLDPSCNEIIEIGAVRVIKGVVVDKFCSLIKPKNEIDSFITELTGITNEMVANAPFIENILPAFCDFIGNSVIVGHNVNFDINFLYDDLYHYLEFYLENNFIDTMRFSRRLFKDFENHRLVTLVAKFGISNIPAHRVDADCAATQQSYEYIKSYISANNIDITAVLRKHTTQVSAKDIAATVTEFDETHPLYGKVCVFTGALEIPRKEAMQLVANVGGINADGVNKQTNYLILGNNDYCKTIKDGKSAKYKKAEEYILAGQDITILSENVFIDLLKDSQVRSSLPLPENTMPAKHYECAAAVAAVLKNNGVNVDYLRFLVDGDRLDIQCYYRASRIMICTKSTYIVGDNHYSLERFNYDFPEFQTIKLANEYRILLSEPTKDILRLAPYFAFCFDKTNKSIEEQLQWHPTLLKHLTTYLNSKDFIKVS